MSVNDTESCYGLMVIMMEQFLGKMDVCVYTDLTDHCRDGRHD